MNIDRIDSVDLSDGVLLPGIDGANPLGFLASLGTLVALSDVHRKGTVALAWRRKVCTWTPSIHGFGVEEDAIAAAVANQLGCPFRPDEERNQQREDAQARFDQKKKEFKAASDSVKRSGLRGAAKEQILEPIQRERDAARREWLNVLVESAPSPEISLGKHLDASCIELRETMKKCLDASDQRKRGALDLLAAFGSDFCSQAKSEVMQATPFCFVTGSGHQYFLDSVRQLMENVDAQRIHAALFSRSPPSDEKLSLRWNPEEDRRYALRWNDPGPDKGKTNWAVNLLAYQGLRLLPSSPTRRGLRTTGWRREEAAEEAAFRWPIWSSPLTKDVVRSLLSHPILVEVDQDRRDVLQLGICAIYQSDRVQVGKPPLHKVNFTPARRIA